MSLTLELAKERDHIRGIAKRLGLDFFETVFEVVSWEEMNEVAAYGGFPVRYPHWRFGMDFERLHKSHAYGLSKIYELVINNDPCIAYLQEANEMVDQKLVMSHVYGHCDFFKNNIYFAHTNRRMVDAMANHAAIVRRHMDRYGQEKVEAFVDLALSIENLIDPQRVFLEQRQAAQPTHDDESNEPQVLRIRAKEYLESFVNPPEFIEQQRKKLEEERKRRRRFPERAERDILLFLQQYAPLERWQQDIVELVRDEAYYFLPQMQTKIMNEGWACLAGDSLAFTEFGMIPMREVVRQAPRQVWDGSARRAIYDRNVLSNRETVRIRTRRGLRLHGSRTHRVLLADGTTWRRLDELSIDDRLAMSGGGGLWAERPMPIYWRPAPRVTAGDVARSAAVSNAATLPRLRTEIRIPNVLDATFASFLGYMVGDGHISRVKRVLGLTTGDEAQAASFAAAAAQLFGVRTKRRLDGNRWRVLIHSEMLADLLTEHFGLTTGPSAAEKTIPDLILRSPEPMVRAFLRAYFDCDGHAGKQGVILSSRSERMIEQTQLLLLNYGILSRVRPQRDGCHHLHVAGYSARLFAEKIGFGLERKRQALSAYLNAHSWFKAEEWTDQVVAIEHDHADVYDISVEETHRYAAQGLINHNSYWHSRIMTQHVLDDAEVVDYADHCSGVFAMPPGHFNPYKVGLELWRDIERRWDRGQFGKEWEDCDDYETRLQWDTAAGKGREKLFEVRRLYNDITFIDTFLTPDFCDRTQLFVYKWNERTRRLEISDREFYHIKEQLLFSLTNAGQPIVRVEDGNFENRGELLLVHDFQGVELDVNYARDTLRNLALLWSRPCNLRTQTSEKEKLFTHDGTEFKERTL